MARTSKRFNAIAAPREKDEQPILSVWRAGIYARLSSDRDLRKGESINSQLLIMRKFLSGKAEFVEITAAGWRESHVHDVKITKEAPNYRQEN